jgi:hypothetical protein
LEGHWIENEENIPEACQDDDHDSDGRTVELGVLPLLLTVRLLDDDDVFI